MRVTGTRPRPVRCTSTPRSLIHLSVCPCFSCLRVTGTRPRPVRSSSTPRSLIHLSVCLFQLFEGNWDQTTTHKVYFYTPFSDTSVCVSLFQLFEGNWDQTTTRKVFFYTPFSARYVRLYPQDAQGHISLRWEVYGCPGQSAFG